MDRGSIGKQNNRLIATIQRQASRKLQQLTRRTGIEVLKAYRRERNVDGVVKRTTQEFTDLLTSGMVAAHLTGAIQTSKVFKAAGKEFSFARDVFGETIERLYARSNVTENLADLRLRYRPRALAQTQVANEAIEKKLDLLIKESIREGDHVAAGAARMKKSLDAAGLGYDKPYYYENLFRSELQTAFSAGRISYNRQPEIAEILWGYEYNTIGDNRVRPNHAALDGIRLETNHPRWAEITPPNGFSCRCQLIEIFKGDDLATEKEPTDPIAGADREWRFNPADV